MRNFSNHPSSLQLVGVLANHQISHIVVCPGSRNAVLVHDMAELGMKLYEVTDERSAGFFANGLIQAMNEPVAVCVTSGSALLNVAPAVAEAYYQQLPLLVISADRPAAWIGQMDGQTLPQPHAFGSMAVRSVSLPEGENEDWHRDRLINEAIVAMKRLRRPVHINVPLSEPLFTFSEKLLPFSRKIEYHRPHPMQEDLFLTLSPDWRRYARKMIIVGQLPPNTLKSYFTPSRLKMFVRAGVVVLYEQLSNIQVHLGAGALSCITTFDEILSHCSDTQKKRMVPDLVVTMGGHIVSKRLKRLLRENPPKEHWQVTDSIDHLPDLFRYVTRFIEVEPREMFDFICLASQGYDGSFTTEVANYLDGWMLNHEFMLEKKAQTKAESLEAKMLHLLSDRLCTQMGRRWHLQVGNSSMVRNLQLHLPELRNVVRCNRGVNGIEGSVSTAVGYRAAGMRTLLLVGDLSFFYDQNGLWNASIHDENNKAPLRILLLNNGGGGIFKQLPGLEQSPYRDQYVAASHHTTAQGIAQQNGVAYRAVCAEEELDEAITWLLDVSAKQAKVALLEVSSM